MATEVVGFDLVPGSEIRLTFEGDRIGAAGGCNQLSSTWALEGDVLVVGDMASTMMACEPAALMDQDTWLSSFLTSDPTVALDGDTLTLTVGQSAITLVEEPDQTLEGPTWTFESILSADAVTSVAVARPPTLTFAGGQVAVDTGCNTGSGTYEATAIGDHVRADRPHPHRLRRRHRPGRDGDHDAARRRRDIRDRRRSADADQGRRGSRLPGLVSKALVVVVLATITAACEDEDPTGGSVTAATATAVAPTAVPAVAPPTVAATIAPTTPQIDVGLFLDGSSWELDAVIESEAAEAVPREIRDPTLDFEDGVLIVDTGCNSGNGRFTTNGNELTIESLDLSEFDCDPLSANVERSIAHVLQGTVTVVLDNGILNMVRDGVQLVYFPT